jgi:lysophospholipid acyltransferase (LPLAT)-like uncharacterized protein
MRRRVLNWMAGRLGPLALCTWFATIRLRWYGGKYVHPDPHNRGSAIFVMWHQRLLCFAYTHAHFLGRILVSGSGDGEVLSRVAAGRGFFPIRGSSHRGGSEALRALLAEAGSGQDFGITPDGPRGPRQVFKVGAVYLASRSGLPIIPITVTYRRCWQFQSWDRLQLPWPFTRGVIHVGDPVAVPPALDAAGLKTWRLRLQETLRSHVRITDERFEEFYRAGRPRRHL